MFRMLYSVLLPFLSPFIVYWIYRRVKKIRRKDYPLQMLIAAGLALVLIFLFIFSVPDKAPANSAYTAPKFENGHIVPASLGQKNAK
ncbi:MAG: hypothetical protein J5787_08740 [Alphaproteobacteria bacterium]|nr:hypothetical protein [Alphaproteobacteria bacterium]MBO4644872.1 hypothetical protein [Alphaproteobacteria bacterium]